MYRLLKPKGKLLLYIPITYKRYLPWSEIIEKNYLSDYYYKYHEGFLMHRYSAFEIMGKVREQKYEIHNAEFAYGLFGALAYELYSLILAALNKSPLILTPFITICYVILIFPIQLLLMFIDFVIPKKGGNGVLITATKNEKVGSI